MLMIKNEKLPDNFVLYNIEIFDLYGHRYKVTINLDNTNNKQIVYIPTWIPGSYVIRDFSSNIEQIKAYSQKKSIQITKLDNSTWIIDECQDPVQIEYIVYAYDDSVRGAYLDINRAFFNGTSVFLCIDNLENLPCIINIQLTTQCKEKKWQIYTSLQEINSIKEQNNDNEYNTYIANSYDALIDSPVEIGTPTICEFLSFGTIHKIVFSGFSSKIDKNRISTDIKKICDEQISFFDPYTKIPPFIDNGNIFIFIININDKHFGGIEHRSSTVISTKRKFLPTENIKKQPKEYSEFLSLISHEYFHSWLIKRIKPASFIKYDLRKPTLTNLLWIFEGFTSYYEYIFLLRCKLINQNYYLNILSERINKTINYPGKYKQTLEESSFDAWIKFYKQNENSINSTVNYYEKGSLIAFGIDTEIRKQSENKYSLDDLMRFLWQKYGKYFYITIQKGLSNDDFVKDTKEATGIDISYIINKYVKDIDDIPIAQWLDYYGLKLECINKLQPTLQMNTFDKDGKVIVKNVIDNGAAYSAGISSGDILIAINNLRLDSTQDLIDIVKLHKIGDEILVHLFHLNELTSVTVRLSTTDKLYRIKNTGKPINGI
ncbi:MAG: M61 family metallopeptidase [Candidatus Kinetoplastibacterium crithidii]|nr:MAG: M61 family metallopeptidase [Candidatus Kinetoplastibacterium crithidii]